MMPPSSPRRELPLAPTGRRRIGASLRWAPLVLAGLLLAMAASQPWWLAPVVARQLAGSSGRTVRIERLWVGLSGSLAPVLHFRGLYVDNAPWASKTLPLLDAREVVAVASWRSLWEERRIVSLLVLRDARVDLERQADGLRNWRLRNPEDRGPGRYRILAMQAERSSMRVVHSGIDLLLEVTQTPGADDLRNASGAALPSRLAFTGQWRKIPFTAEVAAGKLLTFFNTGDTFPMRGRMQAADVVLEVDGRAGDLLQHPAFDAQLVARGPSLSGLHAVFGARAAAATKPFRIEGHLTADDQRYALADAKARLGGSDMAGSFSLDRSGARPVYAADLRSESVDLADWQWLFGRDTGSAAASAKAASAAAVAASTPSKIASAASSASAGGPASLRRFDADIRFTAAHVRVPAAPYVQSLKIEARLADGKLAVPALDVGLAGGHAAGSGSLDATGERPHAEAELSWRGLRVEAMLHEQKESHRLTGALHGKARLTATGSTLEAWRDSATGDISTTLAGGTIDSLLDAEMGLQGGKIVRSLLGGSQAIALRCASVDARVERGQGRIRSLVIDSERTRTGGSGGFDLAKQTVDVVLTPEAKQGGLFVLDRSIRLRGPLGKPEKSLVDRVGMPPSQACR